MAVYNATPGRITSVGVTNPGTVSGVGVATPGSVSGVVNNYGQQQQPFSAAPINLRLAGSQPQPGAVPGNAYLDQALAQNSQLQSLINSLNQKTYAPNIDMAALNAKARAQAESSVNPLYVKYLNDYLASTAAKRAQQQKAHEFQVQDLEDQLKQTTEANKLTGERTAEDVSQNIADVNLSADQYQTDTGQEFEQARTGLSQELAASGLATSGLGKQQLTKQQEAGATAEQRQEQKFQAARDTQQLFKSRTIEDLMKSDELANLSATKGKERAKFDLDSYLHNIGLEEEQRKTEIDIQRQTAVGSATRDLGRELFEATLGGYSAPQRQAAREAYGGYF